MNKFDKWVEANGWIVPATDEWEVAQAAWNAALDEAAKAAEETAQRIVHIAADDGLGAVKVVCTTCAKNIRAMIEKP